ncbi:MAG: hypothetical protein JXJ22_02985 [Bacteroidales bacterium]|nr:hypothetical protein [Bacteroidales bacterium]
MAKGAQLITHKGKEIYFVNYSGIKNNDEFLDVINSTNEFRKGLMAKGEKDLLMLVDVSETFIFGEVFTRLKESGKLTKPLLKKEAIVGVTGSRKILLQTANAFTSLKFKVFSTVEEAKDWLVAD